MNNEAMIEQAIGHLLVLAPAAFVALFLALGLTVLLRPSLARHAMAAPNARSSHQAPTPQGGGIAVVAATLGVAWGTIAPLATLAAAITAVAWLLATFARGRR